MMNTSAASYAYGTEIRMVAYARHDDACRFVCRMTEYVWPLLCNVSWPMAVTTTIAKTKRQFIEELQAPAALTLVSAHGPRLDDPAAPFSPRIGDKTPENRVELRELSGDN